MFLVGCEGQRTLGMTPEPLWLLAGAIIYQMN
jgi:hypothetical protein